MKILHVYRSMGQGGAQKIIYQLCKDVKCAQQYVISQGGVYVEQLKDCGVQHYEIPDMERKHPMIMLLCIFRIMRVCIREDIDIIHAHHRMAAFYARIVSGILKKKYIYTAHNVFYGKKRLLRFALKKGTIIAVGEGVKRNLIEEYGIRQDRIRVVYNAVDIVHREEAVPILLQEKNKGNCLVGTIGRISEQKGMDVFLYAMAEVMKAYVKVRAVVVGDGEDANTVKALAGQLKIEDKVLFLGYQKNVIDIIGSLDLVVSAARWEGLPLTPIEVFSQRRTMIATDIAGNREIIRDGVNGLLFTKDDSKELADKIKLLLSEEGLKKRLEEQAYITYTFNFSYDKFIKSYEELYLEMDRIC